MPSFKSILLSVFRQGFDSVPTRTYPCFLGSQPWCRIQSRQWLDHSETAGIPLGEPHTMAAGFEDMHLGRHPGTTQCHVKNDGVFNGHRLIIGRVKQERWGILFRHTLLVGQLFDQLGIRIFTCLLYTSDAADES